MSGLTYELPLETQSLAAHEPVRTEPSRSPVAAGLKSLLDGVYEAQKDAIRDLLRQPLFAHRYELSRKEHREVILERCRELGRHGLGDAILPDGQGGRDLGRFFATLDVIGISDPNLLIKYGLQFCLFGGSIFLLGTPTHHEKYLAAAASMTLLGCYAMTEIGHGSDVRRLETTAHYDHRRDAFVIHTPLPRARKQFIGNAAAHARVAVTFAQLHVDGQAKGLFGFLVPIRNADGSACDGVTIGDSGPKSGLHGIDNGSLSFQNVSVPRENLLDRFGTVTASGGFEARAADVTTSTLRTLIEGRIGIAVGAVSAMKVGLTIAIRHAARRRPFAGPDGEEKILLDYPLHQRRLLPRLATAYALAAAMKRLVREAGSRSAGDSADRLAASLKAYATWSAMEALQVCREACGGQGYLAVNRLGLLRADVDAWTTLEGDNTVLCLLAARSRLKELAGGTRARNRGFWEKRRLRLLGAWPDGGRKLMSVEYPLALFALREERLARRAARTSTVDVQSALVALALASAERVALEELSAQVATAEGSAAAVLELLRALFALSRIEEHRGWYLEEGALSPRQTARLGDLVTDVCARLRVHALAAVDSFAIPDECLGAPIALGEPTLEDKYAAR